MLKRHLSTLNRIIAESGGLAPLRNVGNDHLIIFLTVVHEEIDAGNLNLTEKRLAAKLCITLELLDLFLTDLSAVKANGQPGPELLLRTGPNYPGIGQQVMLTPRGLELGRPLHGRFGDSLLLDRAIFQSDNVLDFLNHRSKGTPKQPGQK